MKIIFMFLTVLFVTGAVLAQEAGSAPQLLQLPAGTVLAAELSKTIDAHKAKQGDPVAARITQDMLANGKVVIPHDSKITGHITEVQGRPKGQKGEANSTIGVAFDQIDIKGGHQVPLHADIQAIAKPLTPGLAPNPGGEAGNGGYGGGTIGGGNSYPGRNPGTPPPTPSGSAGGTQPPDNTADGNSGYPGAISVQSKGAVGMKGFSLNANEQGSVISSTTENVKLESGTQLIMKTKEK
jgi:hypothetical protein